eukprot:g20273.t1
MAAPGNNANPIGAAALIQQLGNELTREDDTIRNLWSQLEGLFGDSMPSMDEFKKAYKLCKQKEMWALGREYVNSPVSVRVEPAHLFAVLGVPIATLGANPLITRQQRDDAVAKGGRGGGKMIGNRSGAIPIAAKNACIVKSSTCLSRKKNKTSAIEKNWKLCDVPPRTEVGRKAKVEKESKVEFVVG